MIEPIERPSLYDAVGGGEETHFNPVCAELIDRIVGPVLGVDVDDVQREVPASGKRLDLLATADTRRVAIELQYGQADPSHLGRLIGWYAPSVAATDMILVAESFPSALVKSVREDRLHNLALMRVLTGWNRDGTAALDFEVVESSVKPIQGGSLGGGEKASDRRESTVLLGEALAVHGLKDSNAQDYVRLFPMSYGLSVTALIRSGRVVLNVGGSPLFDAEAAAENLDLDWGPQGSNLFWTVSDDVESYRLAPEDAVNVAKRIAENEDGIRAALDAAVAHRATTDEDADD